MKQKVLKLVVLVMGVVCVFGGRSYADANSINCTINGEECRVTSLSLQINYQDDAKTKELLQKMKEYINDRDNQGNTPLHSACKSGHTNIVKTLVEAGADVNIKDNEGNAPLHTSCVNGNTEIVKILVGAGANINEKDKNGSTSLHIVCEKGNTEMVEVLIKAGANVNEKDANGNTPLNMLFSRFELVKKDIVELLITNGTNVSLKNNNEYNALDSLYVILNKQHNECKKWEMYAKCGTYHSGRQTYNMHKENVSYLVSITEAVLKNANVLDSVKNENGDNLLNFASKHGYENIVSLLVNKK